MAKSKKQAKCKKPLPGIELEKVVARIQALIDPTASVTHNEKLLDRVGNTRQFDVVIRGTFAGRPMLGVMECRDHTTRPKGPDAIDGFANKVRNLGADFGIMVSRLGFTAQALRLAKFEKLICYSLVSKGFETGACIGQHIYGLARKWIDYGSRYWFSRPVPGEIVPDKILWQGMPVVHWILRELIETHVTLEPGMYFLKFTFPGGVMVDLKGTQFKSHRIGYQGMLTHTKKRAWVNWTGDAFYEWDTEKLHIPGNTSIVSSAIEPRMNMWEDYDGEIPTGPHLLFSGSQSLPEGMQIPEMSSLNPLCEILPVPDSDPMKYLRA